jgi:MoaA/NifB/PqqE/SkfB family radical SAM enzyme
MCWGPWHTIPDRLMTQKWKEVLSFFREHGTEKLIFTGGEPLIRKDIIEIVSYAKNDLGYTITLSTNTIFLQQKYGILSDIDQIGIPLDGSNSATNEKIRVGNPRHFDIAIESIKSVKKDFPNLEVTIRTVVSKDNMHDIGAIGHLLAKYYYNFDRWKIYQFAAANYGSLNAETMNISNDQFHLACVPVLKNHHITNKVQIYCNTERSQRYVFLGSNGDVYGVDRDGAYLTIANVLDDPLEEILLRMPLIYDHASQRK